MQSELQKTERELKIRNYSPKTLKSYLYSLREYFIYKKSDFDRLDQDNIRNFLLFCEQKQISPQTRNLYLNAIKFFYRYIGLKSPKVTIPLAKKPKYLPTILSRSEIELILQTIKNTKHKLLIALAYGAGLRVSEVIALKVQDFRFRGENIIYQAG